jgi:hypothetical protein
MDQENNVLGINGRRKLVEQPEFCTSIPFTGRVSAGIDCAQRIIAHSPATARTAQQL